MISAWLAFGLMAACVVTYLLPVFVGRLESVEDNEIDSYFAQIDTIRLDADIPESEAEQAILRLQKQILAKNKSLDQASSSAKKAGFVSFICLILIGAFVYWDQSTPLNGTMPAQNSQLVKADVETDRDAQLRALVSQLEQRLLTDRSDDATGWRLYARSLMTLEEFERAIEAYDKALTLSNNDDDIAKERSQALQFIENKQTMGLSAPGPSQQDIQDAAGLSAEDRQAMILGMVENLAEKLNTEPDNPAGWIRLIRSRLVLGQIEQAQSDFDLVKEIYKDNPEIIKEIQESTGVSQP